MSVQRTVLSFQLPEYGEVHVWVALVSEVRQATPRMARLLSKQEQETAARFVRPVDRERFIVAHGILRSLLGNYLAVAPESVEFATNAFGKPDLVQAGVSSALKFNLAHSGNVVLYALTVQRQVGVDVEEIRADIDAMEIAESQFAAEEIEELQRMDKVGRLSSFFRCWTRKEAYVKARGEGLSLALNKFAVPIVDTSSLQLSWAEGNSEPSKIWTLFNLDPSPGYAAAAVIEGAEVRLLCKKWDNSLLSGGD
jgi:4'-phosphopantetheinyl transferase